MPQDHHREFVLSPDDSERLANLAGPFDEHLRQIELRLGVEIANRGNIFRVTGEPERAKATEQLLRDLYAGSTLDETLDRTRIHLRLNAANVDRCTVAAGDADYEPQEVSIKVKRGIVTGRGANQAKLPARDRHARHQFRHRPGRHRQDLPGRGQRGRSA